MTREAFECDDRGNAVVPLSSADWRNWVSASRTRNFVLGDPLLDWLDLYGESNGFVRDVVDERTDFSRFVMSKGIEFEQAVVEHLKGLGQFLVVGAGRRSERPSQDLGLVEDTWKAMSDGVEIICQGVLRDPQHRTYGMPDLLVRSDVLARLFPGSLSVGGASVAAPDLGIGQCHYVVVDIKYTTLHLNAKGGLLNSGSSVAYKVQLHIYNRALGRVQGYLPPQAFLLGRGWDQTKKSQKTRVGDCMSRLASVDHNEEIPNGQLAKVADEAVGWMRRLRTYGDGWDVVPVCTVEELRPNAASKSNGWASAVKQIVEQTEDLTVLWNVSATKRSAANANGLTSWKDPAVTPETLGVTGDVKAATLRALLAVNRESGPVVRPGRIGAARSAWIDTPAVEFFVDFETVNELDDDFSNIPRKGGQSLIFMIGCGHIEAGEWHFECFIADDLTEPSEAAMVDNWLEHMSTVRDRLDPGSSPKVIHWSPHERSSLISAYNAAVKRQGSRAGHWVEPNWFDFLRQVIKSEPVVVKGAHGFGLKAITNAMHAHGLVSTSWMSGPTDGLGAMVGAWWCQHEIDAHRAQRLADLELMGEIREYNEVDCKAMMEVVHYLRKNH